MATPNGTIVVTGANGGLGSAIVTKIVGSPDLARYHGLYTVRKVDTAATLHDILASAPASHKRDVVAVDLAKLDSVREAAAAINARVAAGEVPPIRALILNAGFQEATTQSFSADGFDLSFQANYLSQWLLTLLLLRSMDKDHGRIVVVGSWTHE